jgi:hypothetical protein
MKGGEPSRRHMEEEGKMRKERAPPYLVKKPLHVTASPISSSTAHATHLVLSPSSSSAITSTAGAVLAAVGALVVVVVVPGVRSAITAWKRVSMRILERRRRALG